MIMPNKINENSPGVSRWSATYLPAIDIFEGESWAFYLSDQNVINLVGGFFSYVTDMALLLPTS